MNNSADAVIIGGGVTGCAILYNLTRRGMKRVALFDQGPLASGGSGTSQAICRLHYSNPVTTLLAWHSLKILQDFQEVVGGPAGYVQTGYVLLSGDEDRDAMEANVLMQQALGVDTRLIPLGQAKEMFPMLSFAGVAGVAYEGQSGYADPYSVASSYVSGSASKGGTAYLNTTVTKIHAVGGRVVGVETPRGRISTPIVVIAAGPWSPLLFGQVGIDLPQKAMRHQVLTLQRDLHRLPSHPIVADLINEVSFRTEGQDLTLVSYGEEDSEIEGYNPGVDAAASMEAIPRVVQRCPGLQTAVLKGGWGGLFDVTPDWHPILGKVDDWAGLYTATGFSGHGFKLAPMVGIVMAELITEGQAQSVDIMPLRWSRFRENDLMESRYRYRVLA
jgi:sarcosine oxidase subunit beta